ncbi:g4696 [Coccomyxa elongata]
MDRAAQCGMEDLKFPLPALVLQANCTPLDTCGPGSYRLSAQSGRQLELFKHIVERGGWSRVGVASVRPEKKKHGLWDAVAALMQARMLELTVNEITALAEKRVIGQEYELEVACSGSLVCPAHNFEQHPQGRLPVADAVHVIVHHIASLAQEPSDLSADTNVHGDEEADADSGEAEDKTGAPAAQELGLRDQLYEMLRPTDWTAEATEPSGLTCTMRGYQRRALAWMSHREGLEEGPSTSAAASDLHDSLPGQLLVWNGTHNPIWQRLTDPAGQAFYHNWDTGQLQRMPPAAPQPLNGGALADEMGLGKTVVALALILKRPPPDSWLAPVPSAQSPVTGQHIPVTGERTPVAAAEPGAAGQQAADAAGAPMHALPGGQSAARKGATLIAATPALLGQWDNEIKQHAPSLKVVIYDGLKASSKAAADDSVLSPESKKRKRSKMTKRQKIEFAQQEVWETQRQAFEAAKQAGVETTEEVAFREHMDRLLDADVVLVAYPVLSQEVHHARNAVGEGRSLRRPKRYNVVNSPLTAVHWWRVMLDEAQNVGDGFSQVGDMAALLRARSRWVVTGTPMGNGGLRDLHGLLRVLQHDPFQDRRLWRVCVERPCLRDEPYALERLEAVLKPIMWRNDKASVGDELVLPGRTLERVVVYVGPSERSFYESLQDAAVPAQEALAAHAASLAPDSAAEAGPSSPRAQSRMEVAKAERAARAAEEAAGSAVLDLRKCCDHPMLTSAWRRQAHEGQIAHGTILSIAEQNARRADNVQNQLQASERDLCVLLNTLAAILLDNADPSRSPASPKAKGKGKQKAATDEEGTPSSPDRKRRKTEDSEAAAAGGTPEERQAEALALLRRSRLISEDGIGATWGEPNPDIISASAAIRAWRPIQVSVLEQLAKLLESSGVDRTADEDLASMRNEGRRKLAEVNEVERDACTQKEVRLAEVTGKLEGTAKKVAALWDSAQAAGWQERHQTDGAKWCAALRARCAEAKVAAAENSAEAAQVQSVAVAELLRPVEERLIEMRAAMEGVCLVPIVATAMSHAQAALSALQGNQPLPTRGANASQAAPVEVMEDVAEQRILRLAREGSTLQQALVAAHAFRRLHSSDPFKYTKTVIAVRRVVNALRREHDKLLQRRSQHSVTVGNVNNDVELEAAVAALDAICAQIDFVRGLRECSNAEAQLDVARHNLGVAEEEARAAATAVSQNSAHKSVAAIRKEIAALERQCRSQLSQQRFLRASAPEQPSNNGGGDGPMMAEKVLPEPPALAGSWRAGVRAATGLSAALGSWHSPLAERRPAGRLGQPAAASNAVDLTGDPARSAGQGAPAGDGSLFSLARSASAAQAAIDGSSAAAGASHFAARPPATAEPQPPDESMPDAAPALDGLEDQLGGRSAEEKGKQAADEGSAAGAEEIVPPGCLTREELARLRAEAHSRWLAQRERDRFADMTGPSRLAIRTGCSAAAVSGASLQQEHGSPGDEERGGRSVGLNGDSLQQGTHERADNHRAGERGAASAGGSLQQGRHAGVGQHDGGEGPSAMDCTECADLAGGAEDKRKDEDDGNVCTVCYSAVEFAMLLPCGHFLCEDCYPKHYCRGSKRPRKADCFVCRQPFAFSEVFRLPVAPQHHDFRDEPKYSKVNVFGDSGSKIHALLRRLVWLQENQPGIKSLVFSQWPAALLMVSKALAIQKPPIKHVSLTGIKHRGQGPREVIRQFQSSPDVRVFLLTRGQGAAGLTLTQASHVFLLEPSMSVAVEQQALARVHRFGQTRPVRITRFITEHTVEEEVVREAEAKQSLLSEDASKAGVQKSEDVTTGQLRRLLDAALRQRPASGPNRAAERPGPSNGDLI